MIPLLHKTELFLKKTEGLFCIFIVSSIICVLSFFILFHADWVIGDDYETLQTTAIGRPEPVTRHIGQENISNGRFYPLGHYDLNIITLLPVHGPGIHYAYIWLQFLAISLLAWKLSGGFRQIATPDNPPVLYRTVLFCIFLTGTGFSWIFFEINYPERFLMILLAAFVFLSHRALISQKTIFYVSALIVAAYASYMKEPVFIIFCVFSAANLLLNRNRTGKDSIFYYALLTDGAVFLILYYFLAFRVHTSLYSTSAGYGFSGTLLLILLKDRLNIILMTVLLYRLYQIFIKKDRQYIFEDSLLFAGFFYILAFAVLKMSYTYYFLPAELLALPAIISSVSGIRRKSLKYPVKICLAAILVTNMIILRSSGPALYYVSRTTHMPLIRSIAVHMKNGGILWWYLPGQDIYTLPENSNIMGQRDIYNVFIDYAAMKAENRLSKENIPGKDNFTYIHNADKFNPGSEDVFFLPLYSNENGNRLPLPEDMLKELEKNNFSPLITNLPSVYIFIKKGSYIEDNWLLSTK
ncbi:MAG: hypothetical protein J6Z08_08180 [Elusimicrobiales bacterium]|nr:hypothetical protein [Elusimicrobiales bacterium]